MTKHAKKTEPLQLVDRRKTATVRIPVPFLDVLASIEHSFFDLCIAAGRQVLDAMMEQDREALCGPRSRRDPDRRAGRAGTTTSEVTLGGRRIRIPRPRVRSTAGEELALPSYAQRDPLDNHTLNAVACGISTRGARSLEPLTEDLDERSTCLAATWRCPPSTAWLARRSAFPDRADRRIDPGRPHHGGHRYRGEKAGAGPQMARWSRPCCATSSIGGWTRLSWTARRRCRPPGGCNGVRSTRWGTFPNTSTRGCGRRCTWSLGTPSFRQWGSGLPGRCPSRRGGLRVRLVRS